MSYYINPAAPLDMEIRRIITQETAAIATLLEAAPEHRQRSLHGARKQLKRLRGLLKLVRTGDRAFCERENTRFRDLSRSLSAVRDADALVETVDRFLAASRNDSATGHLTALHTYFTNRRDRIVKEQAEREILIPSSLAVLRDAQSALDTLRMPQTPQEGARVIADGARRMLKKARQALKSARENGAAEDFHDLRKGLKYHRMHLSLLENIWPGAAARRRKAEMVGEQLGEMNDIAVMREVLEAEQEAIAAPDTIEAFRGLLTAQEKKLRKTCLRLASELLENERDRLASKIERKMRKAA